MTQHLHRYRDKGWVFCNHEKGTMQDGAGYGSLWLSIQDKEAKWAYEEKVEKWLNHPMDFKLPGEFFG